MSSGVHGSHGLHTVNDELGLSIKGLFLHSTKEGRLRYPLSQ